MSRERKLLPRTAVCKINILLFFQNIQCKWVDMCIRSPKILDLKQTFKKTVCRSKKKIFEFYSEYMLWLLGSGLLSLLLCEVNWVCFLKENRPENLHEYSQLCASGSDSDWLCWRPPLMLHTRRLWNKHLAETSL